MQATTATAATRRRSIPALPRRSSVGKTALYIAATTTLREARLAIEAKTKKITGKGKKKMAKVHREALEKERNAFKKIEAVARVVYICTT
ncbi:hypothetical protein DVH05_015122 [Phytophthora capsici]|nr:hypothetical protein DVH05_015122 [Phytophthora capsici]